MLKLTAGYGYTYLCHHFATTAAHSPQTRTLAAFFRTRAEVSRRCSPSSGT